MKLTHKRILIFFSVALNIGFLTMAGLNAWDRSVPKKDKRWNELRGIVLELKLPGEKADKALAVMAEFRDRMDVIEKNHRASHLETLDYLAGAETLDPDRLHALLLGSDQFTRKRRELFESHIMAMRQVLGDTDGLRFFARLRAHLESKYRSSHS